MSWWGKIIQGAAQIGGVLSKTAGSLSLVANIVTGIAGGGLTLDQLAADEGNLLPTLAEQLDDAEKFIVAEAREIFGAKEEVTDDIAISKPFEMTGLWNSLASTSGNHAAPVVIQDIHKFLALNRLPHVFTSKNQVIDVAEGIANDLTTDDPSKITTYTRGAQTYYSVKIFVSNGRDFMRGGAVYYKIPLGTDGSYTAWHTCLRIWSVQTKASIEEARLDKTTNLMMPSSTILTKPYNSTTITAAFSGARNVMDIMAKVYKAFVTKTVEFAADEQLEMIEPPFFDGATYTFQIASPPNVGANKVQDLFSNTLNKFLPPVEKGSLPRFPDVKIENRQTYVTPPQG